MWWWPEVCLMLGARPWDSPWAFYYITLLPIPMGPDVSRRGLVASRGEPLMCWCRSQRPRGFPENAEAQGCREGLEKQKITPLAGGRLGPRRGTPKDLRLQVCHDGISSGKRHPGPCPRQDTSATCLPPSPQHLAPNPRPFSQKTGALVSGQRG